MKSIRLLLCFLFALTAWQLSAQTQPARPLPRRANIILIVADGLAASDLSCYGQTQFETPNLDKLAAQGIRFTNYFAGGLASSPAHAALMIGKNTSHLPDANFWLAPNDITIAQVLKNSGYATGFMGEWNLGDQNSGSAPWEKGFDQFAGYFNPADADNPYADFVWRYDIRYNPTTKQMQTHNGPVTLYDNAGGQKGEYIPDSITHWALNFARAYQPKEYTHYRPFFLALNYTIPGNGSMAVPTDAPFSEESWPQAEKDRAAAISRLDGYIGEIMDGLKKIGQTNNTVLFFTSDTVPQKSGGVDPKFFHENSPPDDLHVPMIVYWPGRIPAGQVSGWDCSAPDFLPTATAVAFGEPPDKIDGTSFLPALFGQKKK
jgi:arylsulfatase A-like enzyme